MLRSLTLSLPACDAFGSDTLDPFSYIDAYEKIAEIVKMRKKKEKAEKMTENGA